MQDLLSITKALGDENRVRVLMALSLGELCVCQIIELLRLAPSTVSKHISILKQARLIESNKNGKWVYYRLPEKTSPAASEAIEWARRHFVLDETIRNDFKALKTITEQNPVEVCKKQKESRVSRLDEVRTGVLKVHP